VLEINLKNIQTEQQLELDASVGDVTDKSTVQSAQAGEQQQHRHSLVLGSKCNCCSPCTKPSVVERKARPE
jgi:hypothetical protein